MVMVDALRGILESSTMRQRLMLTLSQSIVVVQTADSSGQTAQDAITLTVLIAAT